MIKRFKKTAGEQINKSVDSSKQIVNSLSNKYKKTQLMNRIKAKNNQRARKHAEYLATLPKAPVKRFFYRIHPKRFFVFLFSKQGAITVLKFSGVGILIFSITTGIVFAYFRKDLPKNITNLQACSLGQTIKFYDRTKTTLLWSGAGDIDCRPVALSEMSPYLVKGVIASEDKKFYSHLGFDAVGTFRAVINNATGKSTQGGSTITQQYIKLTQLSSEQTIVRKLKELILSVELDASYKKDEIIQAYLNEIGFAYQYNGAEAASRGLFDKSAKDLTLDEAAIMVAGIPSPDYYWVRNQDALKERKNYVLDQMVETGAITKDEAKKAKEVDTLAKLSKNKSQYKDIKAPHFVLEVFDQLKATYGKDVTKYGYSVTTTLDMDLQKIAEESVANGFECKNGRYGINCQGTFDNAAFVAEDVTNGQVVALVGSKDFNIPGYGQLNLATTPRSPGSSFKPYDYAALMKSSENWGAGSIFYDLSTDFGGGYKPADYDRREPGGITMRYALGGSRNIPAIKAMYAAGIEYTHQVAIDMGITDGITNCAGAPKCDGILSTAIGDGGQVRLDQHVHGYATFSRLGKNIPQSYILKIEDSKGKVIKEWKQEDGTQAIDPQIAYIVNDMLADKDASYFRVDKTYGDRVTNGFESTGIPAAIKTGTTNNNDNGWMLGHTTKYAAGVWVGNHENKPSNGRFDFTNATGPIWGEFMKRAHEALSEKPGYWSKPEGIKTVSMDSEVYSTLKSKCTGAQAGNVCGWSQSDIYPSWYTPRSSSTSDKATIDTISNLLATECTPDLAKKVITAGKIIPEILPSDPAYSRWLAPIAARYSTAGTGVIPTEKDNIHKCGDTKPTVSIAGSSTCTGSCSITATFTEGTHPVKTLNIKANDQIVRSYEVTSSLSPIVYTYTPTENGTIKISAEIIDSVLYSDSSNALTIDATVGSPFTMSVQKLGSNLKISWSNAPDSAVSYCVTVNSGSCSAITNGATVSNGGSSSGTVALKAKDISNVTLATVTATY